MGLSVSCKWVQVSEWVGGRWGDKERENGGGRMGVERSGVFFFFFFTPNIWRCLTLFLVLFVLLQPQLFRKMWTNAASSLRLVSAFAWISWWFILWFNVIKPLVLSCYNISKNQIYNSKFLIFENARQTANFDFWMKCVFSPYMSVVSPHWSINDPVVTAQSPWSSLLQLSLAPTCSVSIEEVMYLPFPLFSHEFL